jgi:hypothetical protein
VAEAILSFELSAAHRKIVAVLMAAFVQYDDDLVAFDGPTANSFAVG